MFEANLLRDEATQRSALLSTDSYLIQVDLTGHDPAGAPLDEPEKTFSSTSTVKFSAREAGQTHIDLIADRVLAATLDGQPLDPAAFADHRLRFDVTPGDHELTVSAVFRYSRVGVGLHRFVDPADDRVYLYTQFEVPDARRVFACFEQPDLKAVFTFSVTAPEHWTVVSNSPQVAPTPVGNGAARWDFAPTLRMSTYITAIVAGDYHMVTDSYQGKAGEIPMSVMCRQSLVDYLDSDRVLATTKAGFDVFEKHFAHPYPFGSYDQIFVPEYNMGAMENIGCITFQDGYLFRSRVTNAALRGRDNTILHELAHMWFGDLVTMTWWDDLWLNESFAEWASHFAQSENDTDPDTAWAEFCNSRKTWAYRQDQLPSTHPVAADMVDLEAVESNFDGITYAKGASVLRQLVAYVGRDAFLTGVREYFAEHAFGNTQLSDLLGALEKSSGRDLSDWSAQWLEVAGVNTMRADFDVDEDGRFTRFEVVQTAIDDYPTLRSHRMGIGVYALRDGKLTKINRIDHDITGARTEIAELVGAERGDLVLLNDGDLTYTKIRLDPASTATLVNNIHLLDNKLARALCWGAAWDMCRDAELTARDYVDLVLRGVGLESDQTAVSATLAQAQAAADRYTAPGEDRDQARAALEQGLARHVRDAAAGSDHQLALSKALATAIHTDAGAELLRAWLNGDEVPEGLVIDTELRWHLVSQLARVGHLDDADIDAELARDNTSAGRESAAGSRAAQPTAEAKAAAWELMVADPDVANETQRRVCMAFGQTGQEELLAPYAAKYLDTCLNISAAEGVWATRGLPLQVNVMRFGFPAEVADEAFVAEVGNWLDRNELSDPVRRAVTERLDDAIRALRCQAFSAANPRS